MPDFLLVLRVDVGGFADVNRHGHAGARDFEGARLRFADLRPVAVGLLLVTWVEIRELHEEEREFRLLARHALRLREFIAPREDHHRKNLTV